MTHQKTLHVETRGRGTYEITRKVDQVISEAGIETGICHIFTHHTSASLTLCENADPTVRQDLEHFMARLVPDGDPLFQHTLEGPDDMAAHIRSILSKMDLTVPVSGGRNALGTWQGIFFVELDGPRSRKVWVSVH